ncbi:MAG: aminopeptidase P N-terminal domain-containing protein [Candidatus Brocadiia bacterium]
MAASEASEAKRSLFQSDFPPEEFAQRRARLFEAIGEEAHALVQGAPPARGFERFCQTKQFYYCCGLEVPQAYLLLAGPERRTTLYLPRGEGDDRPEGASLGAEDAELICERTGADAVAEPDALGEHLGEASVVYTPHSPAEGRQGSRDELSRADKRVAADPWDGRPSRERHLVGLLLTRFRDLEVRDLSPILDRLRAVKSPREVALLGRAGALAAQAVGEAMRATCPGMFEYELGAVASYVYEARGARGHGYRPIIASGPNAWHGHYFRNDRRMAEGDLVLMDGAPDLGYYTSDIARMWPVGGRYAPWQRELYGFMVEWHKALLERIRPGVTADQVLAEAAEPMAEAVEATAFSKPIYEAAARRTLEFKGHLSHPVGMAVHDVGGYRSEPLRPGVVLTVDPQMWVPEERLYVRVEDTVAVTESGMENLTAEAPLELDDVEAWMREESRFPRLGEA